MKQNSIGNTILNILLFPKSLYQKINANRTTLVLGVILVGMVDVLYPFLYNNASLFVDLTTKDLIRVILLLIVSITGIGLMDVMFFTLPLFDAFKFLNKDKNLAYRAPQIVKLAKVYIIAHFLITPVNILVTLLFPYIDFQTLPTILGYIAASFLYIAIPVWFSAIIARGVNAIYQFPASLKLFVFGLIFLWNFLLTMALEVILKWVFRVFGFIL